MTFNMAENSDVSSKYQLPFPQGNREGVSLPEALLSPTESDYQFTNKEPKEMKNNQPESHCL